MHEKNAMAGGKNVAATPGAAALFRRLKKTLTLCSALVPSAALVILAVFVGATTTIFRVPPGSWVTQSLHGLVTLVPGEPELDVFYAEHVAPDPKPELDRPAPRGTRDFAFVVGRRGETYGAVLVDRRTNEVVHEWSNPFSRAYADQPDWPFVGAHPDLAYRWHGVALFENGDVLHTYELWDPDFAAGLARIDRDSNLLWSLPLKGHHAIWGNPDGSAWVLTTQIMPEAEGAGPVPGGKMLRDQVVLVSRDGEVLARHDLQSALIDSGMGHLLAAQGRDEVAVPDPYDVLHTNDVEVVGPDFARHHLRIEAGDLALSLRNLDAVIFLRPASGRVVDVITGPFLRQHDPDLLPSGRIAIFDNRGFDTANELGRIMEYDPLTRQIQWSWAGEDGQGLDHLYMGKIDATADGRIMVADVYAGRAVEIDPASGEILWQWSNRALDGAVHSISQADFVARPDWLNR